VAGTSSDSNFPQNAETTWDISDDAGKDGRQPRTTLPMARGPEAFESILKEPCVSFFPQRVKSHTTLPTARGPEAFESSVG